MILEKVEKEGGVKKKREVVVEEEEEDEEDNAVGSRKRRSVGAEHLVRLKRDERLIYVQRERLLQRDKRGYEAFEDLVDENDEEMLEMIKKVMEEGKRRDKWVDFEMRGKNSEDCIRNHRTTMKLMK